MKADFDSLHAELSSCIRRSAVSDFMAAMKFLSCAMLVTATALFQTSPAHAEVFDKPIRFIVGAAPGGSTDLLARLLGAKVSEIIGQSVIVENRPGATGQIALRYVTSAPADGSVFSFSTETPFIRVSGSDFQPEVDDYKVVAKVGKLGWMLYVSNDTGIKTFQDLQKAQKEDGNHLFMGVSATTGLSGSFPDRIGTHNGVKIEPIVFAGGALVNQAVVSGHVPTGVAGITETIMAERTGKVTAIAQAGPRRSEFFPGVPTFSELGVKGLELTSAWYVTARGDVAENVINELNRALTQAMQNPEIISQAKAHYVELTPTSPAEAAAELQAIVAVHSK